MTEEQKKKLFHILLVKALLNWLREIWRKPRGKNLIHGEAFIDFYKLPGAEGHHGTCAFVLDEHIRPEEYLLWGPFGYAESIHTAFEGKEIYIYRMDWGIAGSEHFADSQRLSMIARDNPGKKILLVGVRTLEGKFWWLYRSPRNFLLIPKQRS